MPQLTSDEFGNPIWVPEDPLAGGVTDPSQLGGAAGAPGAGAPLDQGAIEQALAAYQDPGILPGGGRQVSPGVGPAVGNVVPDSSPFAAQPQDPYSGAVTMPSEVPQANQVALKGGVTSPTAEPAGLQPMTPKAQKALNGQRAAAAAANDPMAYGNVAAAERDQVAAIQGTQDVEASALQAKMAADNEHISTRAAIQDQHSKWNYEIDQQLLAAKQVTRAETEKETAQWMSQLESKAKEEPSNTRYWSNLPNFGKALWLLSIGFGTIGQANGAPGTQNMAAQLFRDAIDKDVGEQKASHARQMEVLGKKGAQIKERGAAKLGDLEDTHTMKIQRLIGVRDAALERSQMQGPRDYKAAMAQAAVKTQEMINQVAAQRMKDRIAERESGLERNAANKRNAADNWTSRQNALTTDKRERDKLAVDTSFEVWKESNKIATDQAKPGHSMVGPFKAEDVKYLPTATGISVTGSDGSPENGNGSLILKSDKDQKAATELADVAQKRFDNLKVVRDALSTGEDLNILLRKNPALESALTKLAYTEVGELQASGVPTDKDFAAGYTSGLGADLQTFKSRLASGVGLTATSEDILKHVDTELRDMPKQVSDRLTTYTDQRLYRPGFKVTWTPNDRHQSAAQAPSGAQTDATLGIKQVMPEPDTLEELAKAKAIEANMGPNTALRPYKPGMEAQVAKAVEVFATASPDKIAERKDAILKEVKGDKRATLEVVQAAKDAREKAVQALADTKDTLRDEFREDWRARHATVSRVGERPPSDPKLLKLAGEIAVRKGLKDLTAAEIRGLVDDVKRENAEFLEVDAEWEKANPFNKER